MVAPNPEAHNRSPDERRRVVRDRIIRGARRFAQSAELELSPEPLRSAPNETSVVAPSLFALGGLAVPGGYAWREIVTDFAAYQRAPARAESIPGHDGTKHGPHAPANRNWLQIVNARLASFQERLSCEQTHGAGLSTGALLMLALGATNPKRFSSLFLVGAPLELKDRWKKALIKVLAIGTALLRSRISTNIRPRDLDAYAHGNPTIPYTRKQLQAPAYERMFGEVFHQLEKVRREALRHLTTVELPTIAAYGRHDSYVDVDHMCQLWSKRGPANSLVLIFEGSPHDILCGPELEMARDVSHAFHRDFRTVFADSPERRAALAHLGLNPAQPPRTIRLAQGEKSILPDKRTKSYNPLNFWGVVQHYGIPESKGHPHG